MAKGASVPVENKTDYGEKLGTGDFKISGSEYGRNIPSVFGTEKVVANLVWLSTIREVPVTVTNYQEVPTGKKGGTQTASQTTINYTYYGDFVVQFGKGPILGVRKIWVDKQLAYSSDPSNEVAYNLGTLTVYNGTSSQTLPSPVPTSYRDTVVIHFHNFPFTKFGNRMPSVEAELVTSGSVGGTGLITVADTSSTDIITAICEQSGLLSSEFIIEDLATDVTGYQVPLGSLVSSLQPVVLASKASSIYSDDKVKFKPLYTDTVISIPIGDLRFSSNGQKQLANIFFGVEKESSLPSKVIVGYKDILRDHDQSTQTTFINSASVDNELVYTLPIGLDANTAARLSEILLFSKWQAIVTYTLTLGPKYLYLEASDVIEVDTGFGLRTMIIRQIDEGANGELKISCDSYNKSTFVSNKVGSSFATDQYAEPAITDTTFQFFNAPMILLEHNQPGVFIGINGATPSAWYYTTVYKSYDSVNFIQKNTYQTKGIFGYASSVLPDWPAPLIDRVNHVDIVINDGQLYSATEDDLLEDPTRNLFFIGDECVQAATVTLIGVLTYRLSDLFRGRFGTFNYTGTHLISEKIGYYPSLVFMPLVSENDYQTTLYFKLVSNGQLYADIATIHSLVSDYRTMLPYSPVHIKAESSGSDIIITWVGRGRYSYELPTTGAEIATLPPDLDKYHVDIINGSAVVVRTAIVDNETTFTYTSAMQTADFGAPISLSSLIAKVYQISDLIGRGTAGEL